MCPDDGFIRLDNNTHSSGAVHQLTQALFIMEVGM